MTEMLKVAYRTAKKSDLGDLNSLIHISKAYWGYSNDFMERFMKLFGLTENYLISNTVKVIMTPAI